MTDSISSTNCGPLITHLSRQQRRLPPFVTYSNAFQDVNFTARTRKPLRYAYSARACTTWPLRTLSWTKKVFSQIDLHPEECVQAYVEDITKKFKTTHPWALGKGRKLPAGYILPKRKKNFESGRPIIGFVDAPFRPMLNIMAKLLYTLVPKACPNHFALGDMYTLLQLLHSCPIDAPLQLWNQDLAGFFISIETPRFLRAWSTLKYFLSKLMNTDDDQVFSVSPVKDNQPGDTIKGRTYRRLNVTRKIKIGEIPLIITTALNTRAFQLGTKTFQQDRGSPIGSPLSPALCLMVVSIEEQIWHSTYQQFLASTAIWYKGLRYVDNRLLLGEPQLQYEPAFATLLDEHFYQAPIILEYEADQEFLGFQVETQPLEVIYNQPRDTSQILSPTSASPPHVLLSGFRSRRHIVVKCAFPHLQKINGPSTALRRPMNEPALSPKNFTRLPNPFCILWKKKNVAQRGQ